MYTRIGADSTGSAVVIDTSIEQVRIALLADVGSGKTTTCRYLARCWAAQHAEHCVILTPRVHEYADLHRDNVRILSNLDHDRQAWTVAQLLIVDDAELLDPDLLDDTLRSPVNTAVVASYGPAVQRSRRRYSELYALHRNPCRAQPVQARLDWPGAVDVFLDKRQRGDFPQHRWAV